jgi:ribosomal-protein-alanine N-acetyltransferase
MLKEKIITERLVLRNMTKEDAKDVYEIWSTEENSKYMCDPIESVEEIEGLFKSPEKSDDYLLVVTDKTHEAIIGTICFGPTNTLYEWGFGYSFKQSVWGHGYATETVKSIIKLGISKGIKRFISDCAEENTGSAKVLEKCGLQFSHKSSFEQPHLGITYESHVYKLEV